MSHVEPICSSLRIESELRAQEHRTEAISNMTIDAVVTINEKGIVDEFNVASENMFGYAAVEVVGKNVSLLMPSPFREEHDGYLARYLETGQAHVSEFGREVVGMRKDGTQFPICLAVSEVIVRSSGPDRPLRLFTGVLRDITEQTKTEEQLRKLSAAVEQSPATIIITNKAGTIEYVNPRFTETTGYTAKEAIGRNPRICNSGKTPRETYAQMWNALAKGEVWRGEFHNKKKNGETYWESATIAPIRNSLGETTHFVALKEDITRQKQVEADLIRAREVAETANRAKSEFLANMSHEIRTPMTAILGFTDVLVENATTPECTDAANTIKRNGHYLLELINDILDLSKVESGNLEFELCDFSPGSIVTEVASLMRVRAEAKGLSLSVRVDDEIPKTIRSDPTRLQQILTNIVGNAIKFTETGSVQIVTRLAKEPGETALLQVDVIDTGIGMALHNIENVFLPFTQADNSTTRRFGGTGLGLTISRRLAQELGGDIVASSTLGKGSTFSVTIATGPLNNVQMIRGAAEGIGETHEDEETAVMAGDGVDTGQLDCRVLLAEDGPDNQRLISFVLSKAGAKVTVANNGQIAVDLALTARAEGEPYDVILMDMQMPVLDGYTATRQLRDAGYADPIIALTAHAMSTDRDKCLDAGCDDYATKPIDRKELIQMVASYAKLSACREPEPQRTHE